MSRNRALILATLAVLAMLPAYLSAMMVSGPSDAPTLLLGDRVLVSLASYQVNVPYTDVRLFSRSGPKRGDMVLFYVPNRGISGLKRIAGLPGDRIELRENRLLVNGEAVQQQRSRSGAVRPMDLG